MSVARAWPALPRNSCILVLKRQHRRFLAARVRPGFLQGEKDQSGFFILSGTTVLAELPCLQAVLDKMAAVCAAGDV